MYEDKTIDSIHQQILDNISDDYEKSPGELAYDLSRAFAIEEALIYSALSQIVDLIDVDKLSGEDLEKYVYQRKGVVRVPGSYAKAQLAVIGNGTVSKGDLFETPSGIQFSCVDGSTAISGTGLVNVQCTQIGTIGMVGANSITQMPVTLQGITGCTNLQATTGGYEAESDSHLRDRYYQELQEPSASGNMDNYKQWAESHTGVGRAMVFSLWNGDNTVKVVITDSNQGLPDQTLINAVQEYIDPKGENNNTWGVGAGAAPLGAYCTVASPIAKTININVQVSKDANYTDDEVKQNITDYITGYLQSIALDEDNNYVSYAKVGNLILNANGVMDYSSLTINGGNANIPLSLTNESCEIPVLGAVTITYV
ncbi:MULTISPECIES: baseplate J/gp47 family protein [Clostridium]|uniref:Baseplate J/gp47 family protein n=1 Tax=Clostridium lapidicellarium TaxID=3240931 RepID=A0ABV4DVR1_9CLOT